MTQRGFSDSLLSCIDFPESAHHDVLVTEWHSHHKRRRVFRILLVSLLPNWDQGERMCSRSFSFLSQWKRLNFRFLVWRKGWNMKPLPVIETLLSPHIKTFDVFKQELLKVPYFARRITFLCFRTVIRVSRCLYMSVNSGEITKTSSFKKSAWYSFYPAALSLSLTSCPSDVWKVQKTLISGKTKGFWRWL